MHSTIFSSMEHDSAQLKRLTHHCSHCLIHRDTDTLSSLARQFRYLPHIYKDLRQDTKKFR